MENSPTFDGIRAYQKEQRARILESYEQSDVDESGLATVITKADFEAKYPATEYERFKLSDVHKFRQELQKGEGYSDEKFAEITKDLKHFVVHEGGKRIIAFTRKKVAGE